MNILVITSNQVTMNLVHGIDEIDHWKNPVTILYHSSRCEPIKKYSVNSKYKFKPYSKLRLIAFFLRNYKNIHLYIPHFKVGKLVRILSFFAKKISIVDDGLDTFRNTPSNVDTSLFKKNTEYITFKYKIEAGIWLNQMHLKKIVDVKWLKESEKNPIDLSNYSTVLIESPNIHKTYNIYKYSDGDSLAIRHSNPLKKNLNYSYLNECNGIDFAIEKSLSNFNGHIYVGATMVLISVLLDPSKIKSISIVIKNEEFDNYSPIINEAKKLGDKIKLYRV